jgi:antagonist of KipI
MPPGLTVINPGLWTTVQDLGRMGYRAFGVPLGGAFDRGSAALANALLANRPDVAVLELTLTGGVFEANCRLALALAGADMLARILGRDGSEAPLQSPLCFSLCEGDQLVLGAASRGARAYLAVQGGWETPSVLGSRSDETPIRAGSLLACSSGWTPVRHPAAELVSFAMAGDAPIRVVDGPDVGHLEPGALDVDRLYRVGEQSDRMGLRLESEGPSWTEADDPERVSTPVAPGAVQSAGGRPLILGVASGTMGGYPHVAHVISADLDRIAQARPGDFLRFARISLTEARRLDRIARDAAAKRRIRIAAAASDRPIELAGVP